MCLLYPCKKNKIHNIQDIPNFLTQHLWAEVERIESKSLGHPVYCKFCFTLPFCNFRNIFVVTQRADI